MSSDHAAGRTTRRLAWLRARYVAPLPRRPGLSRRGALLAYAARPLDELLYGAFATLTPTIASRLGLSVAQVGAAFQVIDTTGAVLEPITGGATDVARRRHLLAFGATGWALAVAAIASANAYPTLLAGALLIGLGSGPLVHTGDAILIEGHPDAVDRVSARAALVDWLGALTGPLMVAMMVPLASAAWRWTLGGLAVVATGYAVVALRTDVPDGERRTGDRVGRQYLANLRTVIAHRRARLWLAFLIVDELREVTFAFVPLWLARDLGIGQAAIAAGMILITVGGTLGTAAVEPLLDRGPTRRVLVVAIAGAGAAHLAWMLSGRAWVALALAPVVAALGAPVWPIARGRALASIPGLAGTASGLVSVAAWLPTSLLIGVVAQRFGLTATLAVTHLALTGALLLVGRRAAEDSGTTNPPPPAERAA